MFEDNNDQSIQGVAVEPQIDLDLYISEVGIGLHDDRDFSQ
jgi:hypothetical protein